MPGVTQITNEVRRKDQDTRRTLREEGAAGPAPSANVWEHGAVQERLLSG
jgi:hypothetical protein